MLAWKADQTLFRKKSWKKANIEQISWNIWIYLYVDISILKRWKPFWEFALQSHLFFQLITRYLSGKRGVNPFPIYHITSTGTVEYAIWKRSNKSLRVVKKSAVCFVYFEKNEQRKTEKTFPDYGN